MFQKIEAILGAECIAALNRAKPARYADHGVFRDRLFINPGALAWWIHHHFDIDARLLRANEIDIDPLAERITVRGVDYLIPHWCYLSTGIEADDRRPIEWPGEQLTEQPVLPL